MKLSTLKKKLCLLSVGNDAKTRKGESLGVLTAVLYLAPAMEAAPFIGKAIDLCPSRSKGCTSACLFTAGRGKFSNVRQSRIRKTVRFIKERDAFLRDLYSDLTSFSNYACQNGLQGAVRLNGTSDLPFHRLVNFEWYPELAFYDYTKMVGKMRDFLKGELPGNYSLTFSLSEENGLEARVIAQDGGNVAVVFDELPETFWGKRVFNGDASDTRFLDPRGVIVGLKAKGDARRDQSGFVKRVSETEAESGRIAA